MASEWVPLNLPFADYSGKSESLESRGLRRPGVQIRDANGDEFLIGDINELGGVCDDCAAIRSADIVVAYRIMVDL